MRYVSNTCRESRSFKTSYLSGKGVMRKLALLGTQPYEGERSTTLVTMYLLSVRLKSTSTCPIELAERVGINRRTAQRYIYNSFGPCRLNTVNLDLLMTY